MAPLQLLSPLLCCTRCPSAAHPASRRPAWPRAAGCCALHQNRPVPPPAPSCPKSQAVLVPQPGQTQKGTGGGRSLAQEVMASSEQQPSPLSRQSPWRERKRKRERGREGRAPQYPLPHSTCVCILLRPLNHRICPRRSSISAWSISSTSSGSSSSGISSLVMPCPASFRNFRWLVGTVQISWGEAGREQLLSLQAMAARSPPPALPKGEHSCRELPGTQPRDARMQPSDATAGCTPLQAGWEQGVD